MWSLHFDIGVLQKKGVDNYLKKIKKIIVSASWLDSTFWNTCNIMQIVLTGRNKREKRSTT